MSAPLATAEAIATDYRRDQLALRAVMLYELTKAWASLNPADVAGTAARWLAQMVELVAETGRRSAARSTDFYRDYRKAWVDGALSDDFFADILAEPNIEQIRTSLTFTGPTGLLRRLEKDIDPQRASDLAFVDAAGAASRLAMQPARDTLIGATHADGQAVGWARLTDADPCYFCALLASRGPKYHSRESASFQAHDHCACVAVPMFSTTAPWPGRAREYQQLYNAVTADVGGKEKLRAFRRAYEARQRAYS